MEEEILNLLQVKLELDGENDAQIDGQEQDDSSFLFDDLSPENLKEKLLGYQDDLQQLCIFTLIFCLTNLIVIRVLIAKKVNLNQILGFRANSAIVQNIMWLMVSYSGFVTLQYIASILEATQTSQWVFIIKYIVLIAYIYLCTVFYQKMKTDGIFFLSQIKYQKNISFIMVFLSDQLLTFTPLLVKNIYLLNFFLRVNIPISKIIVYGLVLSKIVRIYQCIKLYMVDPFKSKDLFTNIEIQNCIKYFVSLMCVILDQFLVYKFSIDYGLLISHVCYSIYTFYWDVYEDFQLNISYPSYFSSQEFKNRKPLFHKFVYIAILIFNALVRLNWAVKYIFNTTHHSVDFYVYCFEISRRSLWNLLKLDCESYLLKEKSEQNNKSEIELSVVTTSVKITIDEYSPINIPNKEDKRSD